MGLWHWISQLKLGMAGFPWEKLERLGLVLLTCVVILWGVSVAARAVRRAVDDGDDNVTTEAERRAETLGSVLNNAARVVVGVFFVLSTLSEFGVNIGPLLAGASVAGVALGFGSQALVKDVISGFFMLMENAYGVGDIISVDEKHVGTVERLTLRVTQLRDSEGKAHFLPNGSITRVVVLSKEFARALVDVEVSYDADPEKVFEVLRAIGKALLADLPDVVLEPTEVKGVEVLGANGFTVRTLTKVAPGKQWEVARELRKRILLGFRMAGLEIPFPQRVLHHRGASQP